MFKNMRRKEKLLPIDRTEEILTKGDYGVLSTIGENGYPYGLPINYVYMDDCIYVHGAREGHKLDNIQYNSKVSFSVVDYSQVIPSQFETYYESVITFGVAKVIEGKEKELALEAFIHKYSEDFLDKGIKYINSLKDKTTIIKINIQYMTGKIGR